MLSQGQENHYYNRLRPVGLGTIPKVEWEWVEQPGIEAHRPRNSTLPISRRPYGVFRTERPLTVSELYDFEISISLTEGAR